MHIDDVIHELSAPRFRAAVDALAQADSEVRVLSNILGPRRLLEWAHAVGVVRHPSLQSCVPPIPPLELRGITAALEAEPFLWSGLTDIANVLTIADGLGLPLFDQDLRILDFGAGCGRLIRFLNDVATIAAVGVDVNPDLVAWCQGNLPRARMLHGDSSPPLRGLNQCMDLIYSISVFSHLPDAESLDWLHELARSLAPSGLLLLTTHGKRALETIARSSQHQAMFEMNRDDALQVLGRVEVEGFVFRPYRREVKDVAKIEAPYGKTFVHERYARERWSSAGLEVVEYIPGGLRGWQDIYVMRNRNGARVTIAPQDQHTISAANPPFALTHAVGCRAVVESELRFLAFYLPQFHAIPENDAWWGEGFTEWTNVRGGTPLFEGHYEPHVPAPEIGYYDLRDPGTRELQAELARAHGIDGFVYYHYWFAGRRLLERPFDEVLSSGRPSVPFCLCWANENWTSSWNAHDPTTVLVAQQYSDDDDRAHIRWLANAFSDPRYIRVDGKPLFLVYHAGAMPDARRTAENWREEAQRLGFDGLYLCRVESFDRGDPEALGFDAAVEFWPNWTRMGPRLRLADRELTDAGRVTEGEASVILLSYPVAMELAARHSEVPYKRYPCVMTGWDNTPRRGNRGTVFVGSSPDRYAAWLQATMARFEPYAPEENLVFINAWNEWAEGAHLEPDQRWSTQYLEAHRRATGRAIADPA